MRKYIVWNRVNGLKTELVFEDNCCCLLNLPQNQKQFEKWMATDLWEIFFDQFLDLAL